MHEHAFFVLRTVKGMQFSALCVKNSPTQRTQEIKTRRMQRGGVYELRMMTCKVRLQMAELDGKFRGVYSISVKFQLPSFAKVNLHLRVIGKREDGFHDIFTIFQTISLHDTITFETLGGRDELGCDDPTVPLDETNLILRAAEALRRKFDVLNGARIGLEKRIPMGGGLGGGSSNAATTLIGLNRLWSLGASVEELAEAGAFLGSDVPFFLTGGTAIGMGRGIHIEAMPDVRAGYMLIVTPEAHVSTADAYARLGAERLTKEQSNRILRVCRADTSSTNFLQRALINDFETAVFSQFPEIGRAKERLLELGARQALMSGSGASVFGIFDKVETRQAALKALDTEVNWRRFAVAAVSRDLYREKLGLAS
jgi:4-diphosphocytidyl-2-C-methyl-D-erythritol kinase